MYTDSHGVSRGPIDVLIEVIEKGSGISSSLSSIGLKTKCSCATGLTRHGLA